ncbi:DDE-type integrase/transposase/recombinase [Candidatus Solincola tengchongensis]|uniref:DDE-type integrase/transposase/recombinase n=1 Tax=Candidatus Solincola tengchongensis TaxID=2900693 RepID=UPI00257C7766|nr:DDE-type integrase/transposase/recombinase [Candidatus Solincola tengchongensis]
MRRYLSATRADEPFLGGITCIPTREGWLHLAAIVDACARRCCGWSMRNDLSCDLVIDASGMAAALRRPKEGVIHHSDRGSQ